jgi:Mn-dependent DtxR family transcriptional regulator
MKNVDNSLTASMEDYLEMIYRLSSGSGFTRVNELSKALNVHSPSVTRMVQKLAQVCLVEYQKYGVLILKEEGRTLGKELLDRHNIIENFIKMIGVGEGEVLAETEKIEHTVSKGTAKCIESLLGFMKHNPDIMDRYNEYIAEK